MAEVFPCFYSFIYLTVFLLQCSLKSCPLGFILSQGDRTVLWNSISTFLQQFKVWKQLFIGLPWWLSGKEHSCQLRGRGFYPWVRKIPWNGKWQPTLVFLPGEFHGRRSLPGYCLWGCKESDMTERACTGYLWASLGAPW